MFASGFHSGKEFMSKMNIKKDNSLYSALCGNVFTLKTLNQLRKIFNISNDTLIKILDEMESDK